MIAEREALLSAARDLAPWLADHAHGFERARRLTRSAIERLRRLGVFRLFVPRAYGGYDCDLPTSLSLFEELARADASVGFNAVVWSHALVYVAHLPHATLDAIFADGPDVVWTNSVIVGGEARTAPGGYVVSGQWPLVSGCQDAEWLFVQCNIVAASRKRAIAVAAPAAAWRTVDDWRPLGLAATASLRVAADDLFIPASHVFDLACTPNGAPELHRRRLGALAAQGLHFAAVAVGIAAGALEDVRTLAGSGRARLSGGAELGKSEVHLTALGWADSSVRAARALMFDQAAELGAVAGDGTAASHNAAETTAWVVQTCARTVDACFTLAGTAAIQQSSPLQRRLRDIRTLMQHRAASLDHVALGGADLLNQLSSHAVPS